MSGASSVRSAVVAFVPTHLDPVDDGRLRVLRPLAAEHDAHLLLLEVAVLRHDHQGVAADRELAAVRRCRAVRVAEVVEAVDELVRRQRLAAVQLERTGEDARVDPLHLAVNARVDHPGEQDVVVAHDRRQDDERAGEADKREELPATLAASADGPFLRGSGLGRRCAREGSSSRLGTRLFRKGHQRQEATDCPSQISAGSPLVMTWIVLARHDV